MSRILEHLVEQSNGNSYSQNVYFDCSTNSGAAGGAIIATNGIEKEPEIIKVKTSYLLSVSGSDENEHFIAFGALDKDKGAQEQTIYLRDPINEKTWSTATLKELYSGFMLATIGGTHLTDYNFSSSASLAFTSNTGGVNVHALSAPTKEITKLKDTAFGLYGEYGNQSGSVSFDQSNFYSAATLAVDGSVDARMESVYTNNTTATTAAVNGGNAYYTQDTREVETESGSERVNKFTTDRIYYTGTIAGRTAANTNGASANGVLASNMHSSDLTVSLNMMGDMYSHISGLTFLPSFGNSVQGNTVQTTGILANAANPAATEEGVVLRADGTGSLTMSTKNSRWTSDTKIESTIKSLSGVTADDPDTYAIVYGGTSHYEKKDGDTSYRVVDKTYQQPQLNLSSGTTSRSGSAISQWQYGLETNEGYKCNAYDPSGEKPLKGTVDFYYDYNCNPETPSWSLSSIYDEELYSSDVDYRSSVISGNTTYTAGVSAKTITLGDVELGATIQSQTSDLYAASNAVQLTGNMFSSTITNVGLNNTVSGNTAASNAVAASVLNITGNFNGTLTSKVDDLKAEQYTTTWNYGLKTVEYEGKDYVEVKDSGYGLSGDGHYNEDTGVYEIETLARFTYTDELSKTEKQKEVYVTVERTIEVSEATEVNGFTIENYGLNLTLENETEGESSQALIVDGNMLGTITAATGDISKCNTKDDVGSGAEGYSGNSHTTANASKSETYGVKAGTITVNGLFGSDVEVTSYTSMIAGFEEEGGEKYYTGDSDVTTIGIYTKTLSADAFTGNITVKNAIDYRTRVTEGMPLNFMFCKTGEVDWTNGSTCSFSNGNATIALEAETLTNDNDGSFDFGGTISARSDVNGTDEGYRIDYGIVNGIDYVSDLDLRVSGTIKDVNCAICSYADKNAVEIAAGACIEADEYAVLLNPQKNDTVTIDSNATVKGDIDFTSSFSATFDTVFSLNNQTFLTSDTKKTGEAILEGSLPLYVAGSEYYVYAKCNISVNTNDANADSTQGHNKYILIQDGPTASALKKADSGSTSSKAIKLFYQGITAEEKTQYVDLTVTYGYMDGNTFVAQDQVSTSDVDFTTNGVNMSLFYKSSTARKDDSSKFDTQTAIQIKQGDTVVYQAHLTNDAENQVGVVVDVKSGIFVHCHYNDLTDLKSLYDEEKQTYTIYWQDNSMELPNQYNVEYRILTYENTEHTGEATATRTIVQEVQSDSGTKNPQGSVTLEHISAYQVVEWRIRQSSSDGLTTGKWVTSQEMSDRGIDAEVAGTTEISAKTPRNLKIGTQVYKQEEVMGTYTENDIVCLQWKNLDPDSYKDICYALSYKGPDEEEWTTVYIEPGKDKYLTYEMPVTLKDGEKLEWSIMAYKATDSTWQTSQEVSAVTTYRESSGYTTSDIKSGETVLGTTYLRWDAALSPATGTGYSGNYRLVYTVAHTNAETGLVETETRNELITDVDTTLDVVTHEIKFTEEETAAGYTLTGYQVRAEELSKSKTQTSNWSVYDFDEVTNLGQKTVKSSVSSECSTILSWDSNVTGSRFLLEYQINGGKTVVKELESQKDNTGNYIQNQSYTINQLAEGDEVTWRISVVSDTEESTKWYTEAGKTFTPSAVVSAPEYLSVSVDDFSTETSSGGSVLLTWNTDSEGNATNPETTNGVYAYRVQYFTKAGSTRVLDADEINAAIENGTENYATVDVTDTKLMLTNIEKGHIVYYRIQSLDNEYDYTGTEEWDENEHTSDWKAGEAFSIANDDTAPVFQYKSFTTCKQCWYQTLSDSEKELVQKLYPTEVGSSALNSDGDDDFSNMAVGIVEWIPAVDQGGTAVRNYYFTCGTATSSPSTFFFYQADGGEWKQAYYDDETKSIRIAAGGAESYKLLALNLPAAGYELTLDAVDLRDNSTEKTGDTLTGKWGEDSTAPEIIVTEPDQTEEKVTPEWLTTGSETKDLSLTVRGTVQDTETGISYCQYRFCKSTESWTGEEDGWITITGDHLVYDKENDLYNFDFTVTGEAGNNYVWEIRAANYMNMTTKIPPSTSQINTVYGDQVAAPFEGATTISAQSSGTQISYTFKMADLADDWQAAGDGKGSGVKSYTIAWSKESGKYVESDKITVDATDTGSAELTVPDLVKGTVYYYTITATDWAGNEKVTTEKTIGGASEPPVITDTTPESQTPEWSKDGKNMSFTVNCKITEATTGLGTYTVYYKESTAKDWITLKTESMGGVSEYNLEFALPETCASNKDYKWKVEASNNLGVSSALEGEVSGDYVAPTLPTEIQKSTATYDDQKHTISFTIDLNAAEDSWKEGDGKGCGTASYTLRYQTATEEGSSDWTYFDYTVSPSSSDPVSITVEDVAPSSYKWELIATDAAGNAVDWGDDSVLKGEISGDTTAPVFTSTDNEVQYYYVKDVLGEDISYVCFSWSAAMDPVVKGQITSGVKEYVVSYKAESAETYTVLGSTTELDYTWNEGDNPLKDGTYSWKVTAYDWAGNSTDQEGTGTFTIDRTAPEGDFDLVKKDVLVDTKIKDYYKHPETIYYEVPTQAVFRMASEEFTDGGETKNAEEESTVSYEVVVYGQDSSGLVTRTHTFTVTADDLAEGYETEEEEEEETAAVFLKLDSTNGKGVGAIMGMPNNTVYWKVCAVDAYGNKTDYVYGQPFTAKYTDHDYHKPTQVVVSEVTSSTENKTMTINWGSSYSDYGVEYYTVNIKRAVTGDDLGTYTVDGLEGNEALTLYTGQAGTYGALDGYLQITVTAYDYQGYASKESKAYDFLLDTVKPEFTETPATVSQAGRMIQLDWDDMTDNIAPGWYEYKIFNTETGALAGSGTTETSDLLWKATYNGNYKYYIWAYDLVGNMADDVKSGTFTAEDDIPFTYGDNSLHNWGETMTRAVGGDVTSDVGTVTVNNASKVTITVNNIQKRTESKKKAGVKITILDANGKKVKNFTVKEDKSSSCTFYWNEANQSGTSYYVQITPQNKDVVSSCDFTATCDAYTQGNNADDNWQTMNTDFYRGIMCNEGKTVTGLYDNATSGGSEWVGWGDATDYRLLYLPEAGNYTFTLNNLSANGCPAKLTIYQVNNGKLKKVSNVTLKNTTTAISTKALLLDDANTYYYAVTMSKTNKGNLADYSVTATGTAFVDGNNTDDTYTLAKEFGAVASITKDAGGNLVLTDDFCSSDEWVGYGDLTDYRRLNLSGSGSYQFSLTRTDDEMNKVKLTVYQLQSDGKMKKLTSVSSGKDAVMTTKLLDLDANSKYYYAVEASQGKKGKGAYYKMSVSGTMYDTGLLASNEVSLELESAAAAQPVSLLSAEDDVLAGMETFAASSADVTAASSLSEDDKNKSALDGMLACC